jgi:hypothetical protein
METKACTYLQSVQLPARPFASLVRNRPVLVLDSLHKLSIPLHALRVLPVTKFAILHHPFNDVQAGHSSPIRERIVLVGQRRIVPHNNHVPTQSLSLPCLDEMGDSSPRAISSLDYDVDIALEVDRPLWLLADPRVARILVSDVVGHSVGLESEERSHGAVVWRETIHEKDRQGQGEYQNARSRDLDAGWESESHDVELSGKGRGVHLFTPRRVS